MLYRLLYSNTYIDYYIVVTYIGYYIGSNLYSRFHIGYYIVDLYKLLYSSYLDTLLYSSFQYGRGPYRLLYSSQTFGTGYCHDIVGYPRATVFSILTMLHSLLKNDQVDYCPTTSGSGVKALSGRYCEYRECPDSIRALLTTQSLLPFPTTFLLSAFPKGKALF